jgi:VCBS repeat-containing protein
VQKFDSEGGYLGQWGTSGSAPGEFSGPDYIASGAGAVYVTDAGRVQKFDTDGHYLTQWSTTTTGFHAGDPPSGLAADRAGGVYMTKYWGDGLLVKFDRDGTQLGSRDLFGEGTRGVSVSPAGVVYVAGHFSQDVHRYGSTPLAFVEGDAPLPVDPALSLGDPDSFSLTGATVTVTGPGETAGLLSFTSPPASGITGDLVGATLTLTGTASVAQYEAALRSVAYSTGDNPGSSPRQVLFTARNGLADSNTIGRTVTPTPVDDLPVAFDDVASTDANAVLTLPAPGVLGNDVDPDSGLSVAQVDGSAANVGEQLTTAKGAKVTIASDGSTTYDPDGAFDSLATGEPETDSVTYVADGSGSETNTATLAISIVGVDEPPVVTTTASTLAYTEQSGPVAFDPGLGITDVDDTELESATVSLRGGSGGDRLAYATTGGVAGSVNVADDTVTLTGAHSIAAYETALRAVSYENTSDDPGAGVAIDVSVDDGEGDSVTATRTVAITAVNDAPTAGDDTATTDEDTPITIAAPGLLSGDSDPDSPSLTVGEVAGAGANVGQAITTTKGAGATVSADGSVAYDPRGAFDTLAAGVTDTDVIAYRAKDGAGALSQPAALTVTITGVNDDPTLTTTAAPLAYSENDAPTAVDAGLVVTDPDANLGVAIVGLTDPQAGDRLAYTTTAGVSGTVNPAQDQVTLSGLHTAADYQAALRAVTFENTSDVPSESTRTVHFAIADTTPVSAASNRSVAVSAVNDDPVAVDDDEQTDEETPIILNAPGVLGNDTDVDSPTRQVAEVAGSAANVNVTIATAKGGTVRILTNGRVSYFPNGAFNHVAANATDTDSVSYGISDGEGGTATATLTITISGINDPPGVSLTSTPLAYTEGDAATVVDPGAVVTDPDTPIVAASVAIANPQPGDRLDYATTNGITGSGSATSLTLNGPGSPASFQAAIRAVTYRSTTDNPTTVARRVRAIIFDGADISSQPERLINVTPVNDLPVVNGELRTTDEDTAIVLEAPGVLGNDSDPEGAALTVDRVEGDAANVGQAATTALGARVTIDANGRATYDPAGALDRLAAGDSITDAISYRASDGTGGTATATLSITVGGVNDRPVLTTTAEPVAYTVGDAPVAIDPALSVTDDDALLEGGTVRLLAPQAGDRLSYTPANGVPGTVNGAGDQVVFEVASPADLQAALRAVRYDNTSDDPATTPRVVEFQVADSEFASPVATRTIAVMAVVPPSVDPGPQPEPMPQPQPAPTPAPAPKLSIGSKSLAPDKRGVVTPALSCKGPTACAGTLALQTTVKTRAKPGLKARKRIVKLGSVRFDVARARTVMAKLTLSRKNRALLAANRSMTVAATATVRNGAGKAVVVKRTLKLLAPKR